MTERASTVISTPCVGVCRLDERGICLGCGRSRQQIARWLQLTERERRLIIQALAGQRRTEQP